MNALHRSRFTFLVVLMLGLSLVAASCGSSATESTVAAEQDDAADAGTSTTAPSSDDASSEDATTTSSVSTESPTTTGDSTTTTSTVAEDASASTTTSSGAVAAATITDDCEAKAASFVSRGSANPDLEDPLVVATCDDTGSISVLTNAVPDYTYIGTSPGFPGGRESTYTIPAEPVMADEITDVPYIGAAALTLGGIPIFGPTEGTGGDVDSLPGIISACGSHNGPSGFHAHKILTSTETDCLFTPEEVAAGHQLVGYAFDGFPIYTGIDQYTSSWQLTDESLFATDTWAAHTYVEGSGDLDRCNGRTDENGNYAYYTTAEFPYVLGCFVGEVNIEGPGGGDGDRPERPEGDAGERPEPPEGEGTPEGDGAETGERPEPPEGEAGDRPERPERPEGEGDRPERPEPPEGDDA